MDSPGLSVPAQDRTILYSYDAAGRLVMVSYGGTKALAYSYDDAGNLVRIASPYQVYLPLVLKRYWRGRARGRLTMKQGDSSMVTHRAWRIVLMRKPVMVGGD